MIEVPSTFMYAMLAVLEGFVLASGIAVFLYLRQRRHKARITELTHALNEARKRVRVIREKASRQPEAVPDYASLLEAQLQASRAMLGDDVFQHLRPPTGEESEDRRRLLAIRHRFLELEHHAQLVGADPEARESHWAKGIEDLLARILPEPAADQEPPAGSPQLEAGPNGIHIDQLHNALFEQKGLIAELRGMLQEELGDSEQAKIIIERLEQAERQAARIEDLLAEMEHSGEDTAGSEVDAESSARLLIDLVGSQEATIQELEALMHEAVPENASNNLLEETIERIQRTNRELGNCITVLESENTRLREEIAELQGRIDALERERSDTEPPDRQESDATGNPVNDDDAVSDAAEVSTDPETPLEDRIQPIEEVDLAADEEEEGPPREEAHAGTGTDGPNVPPPRPSPSWTSDL